MRLGTADLVLGQTDSERVFALITASIRARGEDVTAGLVDAMSWLAANVPIYAVDMSAQHRHRRVGAAVSGVARVVYVGPPRASSMASGFHLRTNRIRAYSEHLQQRPSVVLATEPMDDAARWRLMEPGELVHVDADLQIHRDLVLPDPPATSAAARGTEPGGAGVAAPAERA